MVAARRRHTPSRASEFWSASGNHSRQHLVGELSTYRQLASLLKSNCCCGQMSAISFSIFNGERAVVLIFLIIVIFSAPRSLFLEVFGLSVLAAAALALEIDLDGSDHTAFKSSKLGKNSKKLKKGKVYLNSMNSRPGASSGILLGSVTPPAVLVARLTQLFRVHPVFEDVLGELEYLKVQYWEACCCSLGVLTLLCRRSTKTPNRSKIWELNFKSGCIILLGSLICSHLIITSNFGFDVVTTLLLVFSHGLATVQLIQHVMKTFPLCASIGEAILVVDGLVLYLGDVLARTVSKTFGCLVSSEFLFMQHAVRRDEIYTIIQGLLLGLFLCPMIFKFFDHLWNHFIILSDSSSRLKEIGTTITFFSCVGFILLVITPSWMAFVHDFSIHPYLWVLEFVLSEPLKIISLCIYWTGSICLSVTRFYNISKGGTIERILLRKYYHLMAVSMFLPALIFQPEFLNLAFGVALSAFVMLEIIRVQRIWPLGQVVHHFMNAFTDHRDSDLIIVSHFSLLLGCALPMWMSSKHNDRPLVPFAGILSLGVGDTMASVVGHKYGVLRWSKNSKKTIEGTAAGITCVLASCSVILPLLTSTGYILTQHWQSLVAAVTVSGLLEAYTTQLDNAFIPLVFYSLLCL